MYKILLVDIDNTLLDFTKAERMALIPILKKYNLLTEENIKLYSNINIKYWKMLERSEITKDEVITKRWIEFFSHFMIEVDPNDINKDYFLNLAEGAYFMEGAIEFLNKAKQYFRIYAVTNGRTFIQKRRIQKCGLDKFLDGIYISDEIGYHKPDKAFFDYVLTDLGITNKREVIMLGDSLTSDIQGAINANLDYVWFDFSKSNQEVMPRITKLSDFFKVINLN